MHCPNQVSEKIKVVYYTNPACPVSWAMRHSWERLVATFGAFLNVQICISEESEQGGKETCKGSALLPMSMRAASLAVKAASLQSQHASDLLLNALRSMLMERGGDISNLNVVADVARQVSKDYVGEFGYQRFGKDFNGGEARQALKNDFVKTRLNRIVSCPTISFTLNGKGLKAVGYQSYEKLVRLVRQISLSGCHPA